MLAVRAAGARARRHEESEHLLSGEARPDRAYHAMTGPAKGPENADTELLQAQLFLRSTAYELVAMLDGVGRRPGKSRVRVQGGKVLFLVLATVGGVIGVFSPSGAAAMRPRPRWRMGRLTASAQALVRKVQGQAKMEAVLTVTTWDPSRMAFGLRSATDSADFASFVAALCGGHPSLAMSRGAGAVVAKNKYASVGPWAQVPGSLKDVIHGDANPRHAYERKCVVWVVMRVYCG